MGSAHSQITKRALVAACRRVAVLAAQYKPGDHHREMGYDGLLFGYLDARFGKMKRQHRITMGASSMPKRIDFRQGGTNPVVIEFVVRTPDRNEVYGSQNRDELRKLARQKKAKARYLLLLDLSKQAPLDIKKLQSTYEDQTGGPGNFKRCAVRVLYIHPEREADWLWKP